MKIVKRGQEARDALKRGIDLVADSIKVTLGPSGRNAVLGRMDIPPIITNDGATIARNIEAEDEIENQGVWMIKEASALTDNKSGDGTTTTTVLLQKIVEEGFKRLKDAEDSMIHKLDSIKLKREVDEWCEVVVEKLRKQATPLKPKDIYNVAITSGEYAWIAEMVTEIFKKIGKDGYVKLEEGNTNNYEIYKGMELGAGFSSDYFISTGNNERQCVLKNPKVLVTNQQLEIGAILPIISEMATLEMDGLIIIAPDFTKDLLDRLVTVKLKTGFNAVALRLPTLGNDDLLVDIATVAEATFVDKNLYKNYEQFKAGITMQSLGSVEQAIITSGKSILIGGNGETKERIKEIKRLIEKTTSVFDKDKYEQRVAFLSGGIAILTIGGESEFEKMYFKLKAEDAINAVQVALKEGVVKGGGLTLKEISEQLEPNILSTALVAPYKQIQENAGGKLEISDDVLDPVLTTISALKSACSLAGMILTTEVVTAFKHEPKD